MVGKSDFSVPVRAGFERARQNNANSYNNPLGAFTTADVRDKAQREQNFDMDQGEAVALGNAANQNQQNAFGQQATVAGLMAPQYYNAQTYSQTDNRQKFANGDFWSMGLSGAQGLAMM